MSNKTENKAGATDEAGNEATLERHSGFVAASDEPHPNEHVAGQTPASETNQPTAGPTDDLQRALGHAERTVSARLLYENGVPSTDPEHLDPIIDALERALKAAKAAKKG